MTPAAAIGLTPLVEVARGMAHAIRPLYAGADRERYCAYLRAMYHYTLESGPELRHAAAIAASTGLAALFTQLAREEEQHHRLAQADLRALGTPDVGPVPASVLAFRSFWNGTSPAEALLGALYVLENVARFARPDAVACLQELGLRADQTRFVKVHLLADDEHGDLVAEACERHAPSSAEVMLRGARAAGRLWVAMHLDAARVAPLRS